VGREDGLEECVAVADGEQGGDAIFNHWSCKLWG
jgi:hypothetical protein